MAREDKPISRCFRYANIPFRNIGLAAALLLATALPAGCASGPETSPQRSKQEQYVQATGHVARSHTTGLLVRPFSSLFRLLFITGNTVTTAVKPAYRSSIEELPIPELNNGPGMDLIEWEAFLDRKTRKASRGTISILVDGDEFFPRLYEELESARESIELRLYIFDNDDFAVTFGETLRRRAAEGIDTKILLDGFGTIVATIEEQKNLPDQHEPPRSVHHFLEHDSAIDVRQEPNPWFTGDHVKTILIDHRVAFTGGMNIAREYRYDWHDLMIELRGPVVDELQHEFDKAWAYAGPAGDFGLMGAVLAGRKRQAGGGGYPVRTLYTRTENAEIYRMQREAIRRAKRFIYVQNPYFTDDVMLYELASARKRGVDVRVIVPLETDRGLITRSNVLAANALLRNGVRMYIYPGMSHVKAAIYDDWVCVGSANWDRWSFYLNKELNIATSEPAVAKALKTRVFDADFAKSVELTEPIPEHWTDYLYETFGDYFF